MNQTIAFHSEEQKQLFLHTMEVLHQIDHGVLDAYYAAALYVLTADRGIWNKARDYIDVERISIYFEELLKEVHFSHGESLLVAWAGNLFGAIIPVSPKELVNTLDEPLYQLALTALSLRRYRSHVDAQGAVTIELPSAR